MHVFFRIHQYLSGRTFELYPTLQSCREEPISRSGPIKHKLTDVNCWLFYVYAFYSKKKDYKYKLIFTGKQILNKKVTEKLGFLFPVNMMKDCLGC